MAKNEKIVLRQRGTSYVVKKLVNRIQPKIGEFLSAEEVAKLIYERGLTVEVVGD